ncbi:immunoglobulin domain protein, partial [Teladorsagia circumcincta]
MKKPKDGEKWVIETNRLTIYDVKKGIHGKGDNAVYQCKAENKHGYVWTNFYLNLLAFKPQLLTDAGEVEAVAGQSVSLECKFFASPNAVITWSSPVLQGIVHNVIPANPHGVGKLVIPNVTPEAEGEYECTGTNKYGQSKGAAKLLVR